MSASDRSARRISRPSDDAMSSARFLAAVEPDKITALARGDVVVAAGEIAFRTLDLDHAGSCIREPNRAEGCSNGLFDRDDNQTFERKIGRSRHQYDLGNPSTCSDK